MADSQSTKTPYQSRYGKSRWISAAQWLAELMCERLARQQKQRLPFQFWKVPPWDRVFRRQAAAANALFKSYEPAAVSRALRSREGANAYSLAAPWLVPLFERHQKDVLAERQPTQGNEGLTPFEANLDAPETPRPPFVLKESEMSKLEGL